MAEEMTYALLYQDSKDALPALLRNFLPVNFGLLALCRGRKAALGLKRSLQAAALVHHIALDRQKLTELVARVENHPIMVNEGDDWRQMESCTLVPINFLKRVWFDMDVTELEPSHEEYLAVTHKLSIELQPLGPMRRETFELMQRETTGLPTVEALTAVADDVSDFSKLKPLSDALRDYVVKTIRDYERKVQASARDFSGERRPAYRT